MRSVLLLLLVLFGVSSLLPSCAATVNEVIAHSAVQNTAEGEESVHVDGPAPDKADAPVAAKRQEKSAGKSAVRQGHSAKAAGAAKAATASRFSGNVSWYGVPFHGRRTASGVIFNMNKLTSAHRTLPFYTKVLVEDPRTGKTVIVSVLDRGPFVANRVMDLSRQAARELGTLLGGVRWVDCVVVDDEPAKSSK